MDMGELGRTARTMSHFRKQIQPELCLPMNIREEVIESDIILRLATNARLF